MMEYNIFKETVAKRICDYLPPIFNSYYGTVESITKVNEKKDALTLKTDDIHKGMAMPVIYLDEMYELFQSSEDMEDVLQCASEIIVNFAGTFEDIDVFTNVLWENLNEDNKVSLFVRYIDLESGKATDRIVNKNK